MPEIRQVLDLMMTLFSGRNVTMRVRTLDFERGQDLIDLVAELRIVLGPNEVKQGQ